MYYEEKTMKSERIYEGRILNLRVDTVELPNRKYSRREIIEHAGAVVIIPVTEDDEVIMVKQFRKPIDKVILEFPAGIIDKGEQPIEAAQRELGEEVQQNAEELEFLFDSYSSPGFTDENISYFLATGLTPFDGKADEDEFLEVVRIKIPDLIEMLHNFELNDSKVITGALYLENLRLKRHV